MTVGTPASPLMMCVNDYTGVEHLAYAYMDHPTQLRDLLEAMADTYYRCYEAVARTAVDAAIFYDNTTTQAITFVFLLKKAIREVLADDIGKSLGYRSLLEFEARIDELALLALDIYMKCREKVHEIRLKEVKAEGERVFRLLEISNLTYEKPETE